MSRTPTRPDRRTPRRRRRGFLPSIQALEARQLLDAGPLHLTITEVDTGETITFPGDEVDGSVVTNDSIYALSPVSTSDFSIGEFSAQGGDSEVGQLILSAAISRTTDTGGPKTLVFTLTDSGYSRPVPEYIATSASGTFLEPTSDDVLTYDGSAADSASPATTAAIPTIILRPDLSTPLSSKSSNPPEVPFAGSTPYGMTAVFSLTLVRLGRPDHRRRVGGGVGPGGPPVSAAMSIATSTTTACAMMAIPASTA